MIRAHENPLAWRAGIMSVLVHIVLLVILLVSFNWHSAQPLSVAQVELWDSLPDMQPSIKPAPQPQPEPPKPVPVVKQVAKPEAKPEPKLEPKAEIVLKKKPPVEVKPEKPKKVETPKPDPAIKAREEEKKREEEIKKLQQEMLADDKNTQQEQHKNAAQAAEKAASAASASEAAKYGSLISAKIRPYVNKQLCGSGKPELIYEIILLPTGEIPGTPKLIKSSGIGACDDAVSRAILQSNPLPKPPPGMDRDLELKFRPNDES